MSYISVLLLTPLSYFLSSRFRIVWLLPIISAVVVWYPFLMELKKSIGHAFAILLFWTVVQSVTILAATFKNPKNTEDLIWRGRSYAADMMKWIDTGLLPEGTPSALLLVHLKQTLLFCLLAFLSGNFLSLMLGSALLNYMNFYVACLARDSSDRVRAFWMGWNPWSVIRVLAFLWLGVVLSVPILSRFVSLPYSFSFLSLSIGMVGMVLDFELKIILAESWSRRLKSHLRQPTYKP